MSEYRSVPTTYEVWNQIRLAHAKDLTVFSSFTDPDGSFMGSGQGRADTAYGFKDGTVPVMRAESTWDNEPWDYEGVRLSKRVNEQHEYWLCYAIEDDDDETT